MTVIVIAGVGEMKRSSMAPEIPLVLSATAFLEIKDLAEIQPKLGRAFEQVDKFGR